MLCPVGSGLDRNRPLLCERVNRCPQSKLSPSACVSVRIVSPLTQVVYYLARPSPAHFGVLTALQLFLWAIAVLLNSLLVIIRLHDAHTCQQVLTQWCAKIPKTWQPASLTAVQLIAWTSTRQL